MPTDDHVKVGVRIKPCAGPSSCEGDTLHNKVVLARSSHGAARRYAFDHVFDAHATNAELYASVGAPLLRSALDGYNATLLAYGQTGAGKTHTIMGQGEEDPGVVMRLVSQLFDAADQQGKHVQFSMLEIYNERIRDLFSIRRSGADSLRIREDPATGPFVENLSWFVAEDRQAMQQLLSIGAEARTVRSTHNNQHSSRAHTVVQIAITALGPDGQPSANGSSMMCVVDLAGSERHDASGPLSSVGSKTLREGCSINQSLTNLGLCISALVAAGPGGGGGGGGGRGGAQSPRRLAALGLSPCATRPGSHQRASKSHIPYRNSALTWLLRESIGGNSKTAILACINPEPRHREESLSTLRFADRAKQLTTRVDRNGNGMSGGVRKGGVLREHGMFPVGSDAQVTIDALREEVRRLESTLQGSAACLIPGGLITTVNGRKVEPNFGSADAPVTFQNGDRVTVWDPASQQEHAFLHLESTTAPKQQLGHNPNGGSAARVEASEQQNEERAAEAEAEAERASAALGLDDSMVSFLEMEEMAYTHRPRRHSLDSSLQNRDRDRDRDGDGDEDRDAAPSAEAEAEERFELEKIGRSKMQMHKEVQEVQEEDLVQLQERKKRQRRQSRAALKTSALASSSGDGKATQGGGGGDRSVMSLSSLAPCVVFVVGCAAAILLPSMDQDDAAPEPPEPLQASDLPVGEFSIDISNEEAQTPQKMPVATTSAMDSDISGWMLSAIGVLGWIALAYTLFRRWRQWLAVQGATAAKNVDRGVVERAAGDHALDRRKRSRRPSSRQQHDAPGASSVQRYDHADEEEARRLRRRRQREAEAERDRGDGGSSSSDPSRDERRRRRERERRRQQHPRHGNAGTELAESGSKAQVVSQQQRQQKKEQKEEKEQDRLRQERREHRRRRHPTASSGADADANARLHSRSQQAATTTRQARQTGTLGTLGDITNLAAAHEMQATKALPVNAHKPEATTKERRKDQRRERGQKEQQQQPARDATGTNERAYQASRHHRRHRQQQQQQQQQQQPVTSHEEQSQTKADRGRGEDAWTEQCCDALAV